MSTSEITQRILSLKDPSESWGEFSMRLGLTPQVVSNYRRRGSAASLESVVAVVRNSNVRAEWLLTGAGPAFHDLPETSSDEEQILNVEVLAAVSRLERLIEEMREGKDSPGES